ncbi:MAG: hypothetical protein HN494_17650 [Opitutae bacterium]|jgi:hypothetical protein|nr:hypothetical protein [Opitutae bacterium]MBT4666360.1 hypothetical protein [Opitutae bacterium]MBT5910772.1 hypothetical protein [Opitutae bacterium]MBT7741523.1 hypothetical protein [Opitutae bacterium]MBT7924384.1 hypothetical protein [Opitutae bacterium]
MEKKISLFLAILTLGFAQQIFAQDENASADDSERWSDFLPLNKELAGDADLPLPFGIGVTFHGQEQNMKPNSITLTASTALLMGLGALDVPASFTTLNPIANPTTEISAIATRVESDVDTNIARLDAWILPFLNVYGLYGEVDGDNKVVDAVIAESATATALVSQAFKTVPYEGDVYGFGAILAFSKGRWWGTLDYTYTEADLDISASEITTHTISPRIGTTGNIGNLKGSIWIGGMHQDVDEHQVGSVTADLSAINPLLGIQTIGYDVQQEAEEEWNFLVGASLNLTEQLDIAVEGGFGDREQVMGNLTFRF